VHFEEFFRAYYRRLSSRNIRYKARFTNQMQHLYYQHSALHSGVYPKFPISISPSAASKDSKQHPSMHRNQRHLTLTSIYIINTALRSPGYMLRQAFHFRLISYYDLQTVFISRVFKISRDVANGYTPTI
jgi:hypothetical protein